MKLHRMIYYAAACLQGTPLRQELAAAQERQYWSQDKLEDWQLSKLNQLLRHAKQNTDLYAGLPSGPLHSLSDLNELPFLTKSDLRNDSARLVAEGWERSAITKITSGSTGAPVKLLRSRHAISVELSTTWRAMAWAGIEPGDRQSRFWGVPEGLVPRAKARLTDTVTNRFRYSAFGFDPDSLQRFHRLMLRKKPKYCYGYVSMLRAVAEYLDGNGLQPPSSVKAVIPTAEPLSTRDRTLFESAFQAPVFNEYGCGELGTIAHECEHGSLHVNCDSLIVEVIPAPSSSNRTSNVGEVVVTDLFNYAQPLIRYRLSDLASLETENCACGRTLPLMGEVAGRECDIFQNKHGRFFHTEFFSYIFEDLQIQLGVSVNGLRLTQHSPDHLTLEVADPSEDFVNQVKEYVHDRLQRSFSDTVTLDVQLVDHIAREPSGKLRLARRDQNA